MKTLDEVIRALEICTSDYGGCEKCPYNPNCKPDHKWDDALHYLKEYREQKETLALKQVNFEKEMTRYQEVVRNCEDVCLKAEKAIIDMVWNEPLSWDELKTMEGKPVWVEDNLETPEDTIKYWTIMRRIEKTEGDEYALLSDFYYEKSQYGKDWVTYRKERK